MKKRKFAIINGGISVIFHEPIAFKSAVPQCILYLAGSKRLSTQGLVIIIIVLIFKSERVL